MNYLVGVNDVVLDFAPQYNSSLLGGLGAGGLIHRVYDPRRKQFIAIASNIVTHPDTLNFGGGTRTPATPPDTADPTETSKGQMIITLTEKTLEEAEARARSNWEALKNSVFNASMTLVGTPELVHLEANDLINVNVMIPDPDSPSHARSHWSSGEYRCIEVVHHIEGGQYSISCQMHRDTASVGPTTATKTEAIPG